ncbi:hypothetical protein GL325_08080 [Aeromicrobium sp. 636]|uniref:Uncharacterized protein n=1 Tax=Aeromicrobium senzhongii TaxID=2663859 RepID=A0A8I0EUB6_9ACTN|nr:MULTISPECIES: hypothetical protein [Aeromicrobium]MBC9226274.1 hypothetical protein [Aeromicrobium senzhongii]MCQ3998380.1 hypothetical protein [Aeromicrobium sp. 636]
MKTPQAVMFGLAMFWFGLQWGAESPGTAVSDLLQVGAAVIFTAVVWELVARFLRLRRPTGAQQ